MKRLLILLTLLSLTAFAAPAPAAPPVCQGADFWGACFATLPKLHCCSAAFLGWSEIVVGDSFPVVGQVAQRGEGGDAVKIRFPSGRELTIPVAGDGTFRQVVTFDEEGSHGLLLVSDGEEREFAHFTVAYRAELMDVPAVESQFGQQHARPALTMAAVPMERPTRFRVRFTDARGEPVRSRTLATPWAQQPLTTDAEGVAQIEFVPQQETYTGYEIARIYPGLGLIGYREVLIDGNGEVKGLPGGTLQATRREGRWYLPLREFLVKASPGRLGDLPERILWEEATRTIRIEGLTIMVDTGMVLGQPDFRADLQIRNGSTQIELHSLLRLVDQLGMAQRTGEFRFRISLAQEP
ncbi:MAG: hypothetical protein ACOY93_04075 [Bacillota bacterium]